jgi:hypothetical protein
MVRATLRGLILSLDNRNRDEVIAIILKQWKLTDRRLRGGNAQAARPVNEVVLHNVYLEIISQPLPERPARILRPSH